MSNGLILLIFIMVIIINKPIFGYFIKKWKRVKPDETYDTEEGRCFTCEYSNLEKDACIVGETYPHGICYNGELWKEKETKN